MATLWSISQSSDHERQNHQHAWHYSLSVVGHNRYTFVELASMHFLFQGTQGCTWEAS
jgi:hypothetical protein